MKSIGDTKTINIIMIITKNIILTAYESKSGLSLSCCQIATKERIIPMTAETTISHLKVL
jgi:hypothetical protein